MRSYPVKENHIGSADIEILRYKYRQTLNRQKSYIKLAASPLASRGFAPEVIKKGEFRKRTREIFSKRKKKRPRKCSAKKKNNGNFFTVVKIYTISLK